MIETPVVTKIGIFDMQVCVPVDWSDEKATKFANAHNPCGTEGGWQMRKEGDKNLKGDPERVPCAERPGCVHIMFDA